MTPKDGDGERAHWWKEPHELRLESVLGGSAWDRGPGLSQKPSWGRPGVLVGVRG